MNQHDRRETDGDRMNVLSSPQSGNALASTPNMGSGLAQGAADLKKYHPIWQQEFIDGTTTLQFPDWLKSQGLSNPALPRR